MAKRMDPELKTKKTLWLAAIFLAAMILLYDVSVNVQFSLPRDVARADPEREAQYQDCFEEKDVEIHRIAFATIDNPDVQKEFINTQRDQAATACRALFPPELVTVTTPFRFNLLVFTPRFW